jgi:hypothetical protein
VDQQRSECGADHGTSGGIEQSAIRPARARGGREDALVGILIAADGCSGEPTCDGTDSTADERRVLPGTGAIVCRDRGRVAEGFDRGDGAGSHWPRNGGWFYPLSIEGRTNATDQGRGSQ